MRRFLLSFALLVSAADAQPANPPKGELLWPGGAPGAQGTEDIDKPTLAAYPVPAGRGTGTAVIVCPGGGYQGLSMDKEGDQIARWLNSLGVTSFVLKYRLGRSWSSKAWCRQILNRKAHSATGLVLTQGHR